MPSCGQYVILHCRKQYKEYTEIKSLPKVLELIEPFHIFRVKLPVMKIRAANEFVHISIRFRHLTLKHTPYSLQVAQVQSD